ncbi:NADPH-dependent FMN reductase [Winogradskyella bathintestinalis]|uniref:NAD(P)H-dependent oxidoreductase n=1 Tax=Winogradskyella bathintestinalis TaxID=3035208 RepID=A0ABT7ZW94_9FLAO|nr:NAD(P)H-dependent oxidoreductase [Winogradskyella bathintestinalis]MDN3493270.1 NAD(P)H-dependent oxidoreductase [Winogradskyella bathintestinalis]
MKQIIVFAGSNSSDSINKKLATYAASLIDNVTATILDLNNFNLPIYSKDLETEEGIPKNATRFLEILKKGDGIVLSLAENNGAYSAVFKNLFDWLSRAEQKNWLGKPMLLMATSPGARGGQSVLQMALDRFPRHDANIVGQFSFPSFDANFSDGMITNTELNDQLLKEVEQFKNSI